MSLQVWLPLNGSLENNGLSEAEFSTSTAVVDNTGKIGKSYKFSKMSGYGIYLKSGITSSNFMTKYINNKSWTLCAWVKSAADNTCIMSLTYGLILYSGKNPSVNLYNSSRSVQSTCSIPTNDNKWHHITATYDVKTNDICIYVDGKIGKKEKYTSGYTYASSWSNEICIGRNTNAGSETTDYFYQGNINDVRIYDNCLSAKEIREISKGLILHYPLNQPEQSKNLIAKSWTMNDKFSTASCTGEKKIVSDSDAAGGYHIECKCTEDGSGGFHFPLFPKDTTKIGKIYTWSFCAKCSINKSGRVGHECGGTKNIELTTQWKKYNHTWTFIDATYHSFVFYPGFKTGEVLYIKNFKIEEGENLYPQWTPAEADDINWNDQTEYDTSGYKNNGTINGLINIKNNSPRNSICYNFSTESSYIITPQITTSGFSNNYTFSWWAKINNISGKMAWGFADGNKLNLYPVDNFYLNTGDGHNNPFKNDSGESISVSKYNDAKWHHYAITNNGTKCTLYIDGKNIGKAVNSREITGTKIILSGWNIANEYRWTEGQISDFRLYTTALSDSDITELYNTPVFITKSGTILTQGEYIENDQN